WPPRRPPGVRAAPIWVVQMNQLKAAATATTIAVIRTGSMRLRCWGAGAAATSGTTSGDPAGLAFSGRSSAVDISGPDLPPAARCTTALSYRPKRQPTPDATRDATGRSDSQLGAAESV